MREEKNIVKRFYDTYGWRETGDGIYQDTAAFVDTRPVLGRYHARCMRRIGKALGSPGELFLDAGCGALPSRDYVDFSRAFQRRVCLDLTATALQAAQAKLGGCAWYVQADVTKIPFKEGTFDASLCAHVLYHVPADEQETAIHELSRTLRPGGRAVIVYAWPDCLMTRLAVRFNPRLLAPKVPGARWLWRTFVKRHRDESNVPVEAPPSAPKIYFAPHPYRWFQERVFPHVPFEMRCWQSAGLCFSRAFIPNGFLGRVLLRGISVLEDLFPHTMARLGAYPLFIIGPTRSTEGRREAMSR